MADRLDLQDDVAKAEPRIDEYTAKLVSKGRWDVPGYKASIHLSAAYVKACLTDGNTRRSLAILPWSRVVTTVHRSCLQMTNPSTKSI